MRTKATLRVEIKATQDFDWDALCKTVASAIAEALPPFTVDHSSGDGVTATLVLLTDA